MQFRYKAFIQLHQPKLHHLCSEMPRGFRHRVHWGIDVDNSPLPVIGRGTGGLTPDKSGGQIPKTSVCGQDILE
jgi:hypothetical protein